MAKKSLDCNQVKRHNLNFKFVIENKIKNNKMNIFILFFFLNFIDRSHSFLASLTSNLVHLNKLDFFFNLN